MTVADIKEFIDKQTTDIANTKSEHLQVLELATTLSMVDDMLDQLDEWVRLDDESIDVTDRYPEDEETVLCESKYDGLCLGYYDSYEGKFIYNDDSTTWIKEVIAWKPLPKPYERKE